MMCGARLLDQGPVSLEGIYPGWATGSDRSLYSYRLLPGGVPVHGRQTSGFLFPGFRGEQM